MRTLLLLRGSAGCGKSTWIQNNNLKNYTLSADDIRMMYSSPIILPDGTTGINQAINGIVWKTLYQILEARMQNGDFTVIDATNSKTVEMNRYKELCKQYKYRIYCVDFTDIPIEITKYRNKLRPPHKIVPDSVIDNMYARFATQKIPSGITVIKPNELHKIWMIPIDLSDYKCIHCIGDIHGCHTALQEYFNKEDGMKDDEFYIFTGDYIDRGIENVEVVKFLLSIYEKQNVILIEGNHDIYLHRWANDITVTSKEFNNHTQPQLEQAKINKKEVRKLYRKMAQCAYYTYNDILYFVTHGGVSNIPVELSFIPTSQMIKGVGRYEDIRQVTDSFQQLCSSSLIQIFGHRNIDQLPININEQNFNLEGRVEFGGTLRAVRTYKNNNNDKHENTHVVSYTKNLIFKEFKEEIKTISEKKNVEKNVSEIVSDLRSSEFIQEKKFENISSFNFTRQAFNNGVWNNQTIQARGLYIDTNINEIVIRSYNKFFNINERPETKLNILKDKFSFPITAYVKENGFLGLVGYDKEKKELIITTKSSIDGDYSQFLKNIIYDKITSENIEKMKKYIIDNNVTFVFECIDMINDPHIIEYEGNKLFLLDVVYNDINFKKIDYEILKAISENIGVTCKEKAIILNNWSEFNDWYCTIIEEDYKYNGRYIEGFVVEDANNYMVKIKLEYYKFWKFMRGIASETINHGNISGKMTSALTNSLSNLFYGWIRNLVKEMGKENIPKDICTLRKQFYANLLNNKKENKNEI